MTVTLVHLYSGCASYESYYGFWYVFSDRQADGVCVCVVFVVVSLCSTISLNTEITLEEYEHTT